MAKKNPGVSITAVINPIDRLKLEVLVRDEILTRGQNSSVSSMVNTFLGIMLSSPLMHKKVLACAEKQAAQDAKLGRTESAAQKVLAAYRGAPVSSPTPQPSQSTQPAQPEPEPAEPAEQPVFDLASLNPGLRVASKVRPAGYPGSEAPMAPSEPTPAEAEDFADAGNSKPARGVLGDLSDKKD
jgi:hypothetical protein